MEQVQIQPSQSLLSIDATFNHPKIVATIYRRCRIHKHENPSYPLKQAPQCQFQQGIFVISLEEYNNTDTVV